MTEGHDARQPMRRQLLLNAALGALLGAAVGVVILAMDVASIATLITQSGRHFLFTAAFFAQLMATFSVALVATSISSSSD